MYGRVRFANIRTSSEREIAEYSYPYGGAAGVYPHVRRVINAERVAVNLDYRLKFKRDRRYPSGNRPRVD